MTSAILLPICYSVVALLVTLQFLDLMSSEKKEKEKEEEPLYKIDRILQDYTEEFEHTHPLFYALNTNIKTIEHIVSKLDMGYEKSLLEDAVNTFENLFDKFIQLNDSTVKVEIDKALTFTSAQVKEIAKLCTKEYERVNGTKVISENVEKHEIMHEYLEDTKLTNQLIENRKTVLGLKTEE